MRTNVRRSLIALLAGLALLLFGVAPSASASVPQSGGTWTAVVVDSVGSCVPSPYCVVVANSPNSQLIHPNGVTVISDCDVTLTVRIYANGYTSITAVDVTGPEPCGDIEAQNLPWHDQFCEFDPDDPGPSQYWDQIYADFISPLGAVTGRIYAELNSGGGSLSVNDPIFGSASPPFSLRADGTSGSAPYDLDNAITIHSVEGDCLWTEFP